MVTINPSAARDEIDWDPDRAGVTPVATQMLQNDPRPGDFA